MKIISKIESNIREIAIQKFLETNPKTARSVLRNGVVDLNIPLVVDKTFIRVSVYKQEIIFELEKKLDGNLFGNDTSYRFSVNYSHFFVSKKAKMLKKHATEYFLCKYGEILNEDFDLKTVRKIKLKNINA